VPNFSIRFAKSRTLLPGVTILSLLLIVGAVDYTGNRRCRMSFVITEPEMVAAAAENAAGIGSSLRAANAAAAGPTTTVMAAAEDEVSAAIASLFSSHARGYQALSAQAAAFHTEFVRALSGASGAYVATEVANASPLQTPAQDLLGAINAPAAGLLGRPLVGNGANGTTNAQGAGTPGGPGGLIYGNGGNGGNSVATGAPGGSGGSAGLIGKGGNGGNGGPGAQGGTGGRGGLLYGKNGAHGAAGPALGPGMVGLALQNDDLIAYISVGGGPYSPAIVDTGSTGLIVPPQDVNGANLGPPTGSGSVTYGDATGGFQTVNYTTYNTTVNFGNGLVTQPTTVGVITGQNASQQPAILGIGANAGGPFNTSPVTALPGTYGQGVLLDEPAGIMEFGPNPLPPYASVTGAPVPVNPLGLSVASKVTTTTGGFIDSGGLNGSIPYTSVPGAGPGSVGGYVPVGDVIKVYTDSTDTTLLYSQTVTSANDPQIVSPPPNDNFNSGVYPFTQAPIYVSYSPANNGTMYFDS
jgi:hypothetical protein